MEPLSLFSRLIDAAEMFWKDIVCRHREIETCFTSSVFLEDGYERCSGAAECKNCGRPFVVYVPNKED